MLRVLALLLYSEENARTKKPAADHRKTAWQMTMIFANYQRTPLRRALHMSIVLTKRDKLSNVHIVRWPHSWHGRNHQVCTQDAEVVMQVEVMALNEWYIFLCTTDETVWIPQPTLCGLTTHCKHYHNNYSKYSH